MSHTKRHRALYDMVLISFSAAVIAVVSPWSIPLGVVPLTLATLAVMLTGAVCGTWRASIATLVYLAIGFVGAPVFSGFGGGVGYLLSPTGGFLVGYVACAAIVGMSKRYRKTWQLLVLCTAGILCCYALGTIWLMAVSGLSFFGALPAVAPFAVFDAAKIAAVCMLAPPIRRACAHLL